MGLYLCRLYFKRHMLSSSMYGWVRLVGCSREVESIPRRLPASDGDSARALRTLFVSVVRHVKQKKLAEGSGLTFKRLKCHKLEIKVGHVKPDLDLNRVYTHGFEQDSIDWKIFEIPDGCPASKVNKSCLETQVFCDALKSWRFR